MASRLRMQGMRAPLLRPWERYHVGRQRGGRWPAGGGLISGLSRSGFNARPWLSSSRMKAAGWGMVLAMGAWLGRAGGEGAPPDAA